MVATPPSSWILLPLIAIAATLYALLFSTIAPPARGIQELAVDANAPSSCDYSAGTWVLDPSRQPSYSEDCPFHRNAWNCQRSRRPGMERISAWRWIPRQCELPAVDPAGFLAAMRGRRLGFVGDSLNENFLVSLLCVLRRGDPVARKWKRKGAWRGAFFPSFNVTIGYHRAVLLAQYRELQPSDLPGPLKNTKLKKAFRVDVDVPAPDWASVLSFYDVFIFNTGHWWSRDKFPDDEPLVFYRRGKPVLPPLGMREGLSAVLRHMVPRIEAALPSTALALWRLQSPRHFEGGEWNQNGSCMSETLLSDQEREKWFSSGTNSEAREINTLIQEVLQTSQKFRVLNITPLSEYRRDAHPAIWLGRKDAHLTWGQDCLHWCLPGLPDTWVDILCEIILGFFHSRA
ncbi:hypothetical protein SELMODRAFT_80669 [Selaginella moellendorffii]|uniref:Uncharacterized protein n=1 Tax=Selaginella moellendorffii TaxID=88036 RepID=D8QX05_SELML|nr:protein trichome birefringence-like 12 [Selaginella moellendorffii]EFJ35326.1 hypothetical protein SELMODRAFT_80669 [Selaginella moellendorffii]|eukprot:XP_002963455.1 protein trichome birefringence-like 12 [Selaginella moellendorffii]